DPDPPDVALRQTPVCIRAEDPQLDQLPHVFDGGSGPVGRGGDLEALHAAYCPRCFGGVRPSAVEGSREAAREGRAAHWRHSPNRVADPESRTDLEYNRAPV